MLLNADRATVCIDDADSTVAPLAGRIGLDGSLLQCFARMSSILEPCGDLDKRGAVRW